MDVDKSILYEEIQTNLGKRPDFIWTDFASNFLNETYANDARIYGSDTAELYDTIFQEEETFKHYDRLNEEKGTAFKGYQGQSAAGKGWEPAPAVRSVKGVDTSSASGGIKMPGEEIEGLGGKLKALFANLGGGIKRYFGNGIAGVLANPLPLIAAGAGAGAIIALVRKFKKLSDEKKKAALSKLPKEQRTKAIDTLAKSEAELKKELEEKKKD